MKKWMEIMKTCNLDENMISVRRAMGKEYK